MTVNIKINRDGLVTFQSPISVHSINAAVNPSPLGLFIGPLYVHNKGTTPIRISVL